MALNQTTPTRLPKLENQLFDDYSDELLTFAWIACIIFIIVGVPGNLLTIVALLHGKQARNSTAIFIINLSCSDLLFGCFNLPLAASTFKQRAWTYSELLCRLFPLLRYGLLAVSLLSVSLITINRYIIIAHPRQYPRIYQRRYLALMVAATWVLTFSIMIPTWRGDWGRFGLDKSIGSCSILHDVHNRSPKEFLFITAFMLPCVCIVICYARIFLLVRQAAIRTREPAALKINADAALPTPPPPPPLPSSAPAPAPAQPEDAKQHPFIVNETLAYIDDSASSESLPISYNIKLKTLPLPLDGKEPPIDANVVLSGKDNSHAINNAKSEVNEATAVAGNSNSNSNNKMSSRNTKSTITTSLRTSFTRFNSRKTHYVSIGNTSNASSIYPGRMSSKDRRLLKMILVIFVWFVICYLPITVAKIWKSANDVHVFNIMGYLLIYLTTCINPLIYVLMSSEYRRAYWNLLRCHKSEQLQLVGKKKHTESNRQTKT